MIAYGAEIDLVLTLPNNQIWAIEIKLGLAPKASRGFHHAAEDINAHKKFIIYGGDDMYQHPHNTQVISLQRFLAQLISTV